MMTRQQAIDMFQSDDLIGIGVEADEVRKKLHPDGIVSYIIDRNIDYTKMPSKDLILAKIQETLALGGTGVRLQGSLRPHRKIEWYEDLLRTIKSRFDIWCHCFSALELVNIAQISGLSLRDTLTRLRDAGLDSIPGGAEILDANEWIEVHRTAHALGMQTTASVMFGRGETIEDRMERLDLIRHAQEDTGGFAAFSPSLFQPEATAVEYLKMLALSRVYLNNILNIQASWVTPGLKLCQVGLRFGGNDVGSVLVEENVGRHVTEEELRRLIRHAGFVPKQRDTLYRTYFLN